MKTYLTIGYFEGEAETPLNYTVEAYDVMGAIIAASKLAIADHDDGTEFINTFVILDNQVVSSWAG